MFIHTSLYDTGMYVYLYILNSEMSIGKGGKEDREIAVINF